MCLKGITLLKQHAGNQAELRLRSSSKPSRAVPELRQALSVMHDQPNQTELRLSSGKFHLCVNKITEGILM